MQHLPQIHFPYFVRYQSVKRIFKLSVYASIKSLKNCYKLFVGAKSDETEISDDSLQQFKIRLKNFGNLTNDQSLKFFCEQFMQELEKEITWSPTPMEHINYVQKQMPLKSKLELILRYYLKSFVLETPDDSDSLTLEFLFIVYMGDAEFAFDIGDTFCTLQDKLETCKHHSQRTWIEICEKSIPTTIVTNSNNESSHYEWANANLKIVLAVLKSTVIWPSQITTEDVMQSLTKCLKLIDSIIQHTHNITKTKTDSKTEVNWNTDCWFVQDFSLPRLLYRCVSLISLRRRIDTIQQADILFYKNMFDWFAETAIPNNQDFQNLYSNRYILAYIVLQDPRIMQSKNKFEQLLQNLSSVPFNAMKAHQHENLQFLAEDAEYETYDDDGNNVQRNDSSETVQERLEKMRRADKFKPKEVKKSSNVMIDKFLKSFPHLLLNSGKESIDGLNSLHVNGFIKIVQIQSWPNSIVNMPNWIRFHVEKDFENIIPENVDPTNVDFKNKYLNSFENSLKLLQTHNDRYFTFVKAYNAFRSKYCDHLTLHEIGDTLTAKILKDHCMNMLPDEVKHQFRQMSFKIGDENNFDRFMENDNLELTKKDIVDQMFVLEDNLDEKLYISETVNCQKVASLTQCIRWQKVPVSYEIKYSGGYFHDSERSVSRIVDISDKGVWYLIEKLSKEESSLLSFVKGGKGTNYTSFFVYQGMKLGSYYLDENKFGGQQSSINLRGVPLLLGFKHFDGRLQIYDKMRREKAIDKNLNQSQMLFCDTASWDFIGRSITDDMDDKSILDYMHLNCNNHFVLRKHKKLSAIKEDLVGNQTIIHQIQEVVPDLGQDKYGNPIVKKKTAIVEPSKFDIIVDSSHPWMSYFEKLLTSIEREGFGMEKNTNNELKLILHHYLRSDSHWIDVELQISMGINNKTHRTTDSLNEDMLLLMCFLRSLHIGVELDESPGSLWRIWIVQENQIFTMTPMPCGTEDDYMNSSMTVRMNLSSQNLLTAFLESSHSKMNFDKDETEQFQQKFRANNIQKHVLQYLQIQGLSNAFNAIFLNEEDAEKFQSKWKLLLNVTMFDFISKHEWNFIKSLFNERELAIWEKGLDIIARHIAYEKNKSPKKTSRIQEKCTIAAFVPQSTINSFLQQDISSSNDEFEDLMQSNMKLTLQETTDELNHLLDTIYNALQDSRSKTKSDQDLLTSCSILLETIHDYQHKIVYVDETKANTQSALETLHNFIVRQGFEEAAWDKVVEMGTSGKFREIIDTNEMQNELGESLQILQNLWNSESNSFEPIDENLEQTLYYYFDELGSKEFKKCLQTLLVADETTAHIGRLMRKIKVKENEKLKAEGYNEIIPGRGPKSGSKGTKNGWDYNELAVNKRQKKEHRADIRGAAGLGKQADKNSRAEGSLRGADHNPRETSY